MDTPGDTPDPAVDELYLDPDLLELQQLVVGMITIIEGRVDALKAEIVALKQEIARLRVLAARPSPPATAPPPERKSPMTYSFTVSAASKAEAKAKIAAELVQVVRAQPTHAKDRAQAEAAACAFVDLLPDDADKDVHVSVNGSISWTGASGAPAILSGASIGVHASVERRTT